MHIHSYQIHNVLNVYRRQLSQGTVRGIAASAVRKKPALDRIDISSHGRHQSIFDKISSEIVERITSFEPGAESESPSAGELGKTGFAENKKTEGETTFTYTLIDEHNRKTTQILPIKQFGSEAEVNKSSTEVQTDTGINSDSE